MKLFDPDSKPGRRKFLTGASACLALAGCMPYPQYKMRFKLSASGIVGGRRSGSSTVFETQWTQNLIVIDALPRWQPKSSGDALVWDLGKRGKLVALWNSVRDSGTSFAGRIGDLSVLLSKEQYDSRGATYESGVELEQIERSTKRVPVSPYGWPRVIKVTDPNDYRTISILPENSAEAVREALGEDAQFDGFWLERTEEPVSRGIEKTLPFLGQLKDAKKELRDIDHNFSQASLGDWDALHDYNFKLDYY